MGNTVFQDQESQWHQRQIPSIWVSVPFSGGITFSDFLRPENVSFLSLCIGLYPSLVDGFSPFSTLEGWWSDCSKHGPLALNLHTVQVWSSKLNNPASQWVQFQITEGNSLIGSSQPMIWLPLVRDFFLSNLLCPGVGGDWVESLTMERAAASQLMDEEAVLREQRYGLLSAHKESTSIKLFKQRVRTLNVYGCHFSTQQKYSRNKMDSRLLCWTKKNGDLSTPMFIL